MNVKTIHYLSGSLLFTFIIAHLGNHLISLQGFEKHIEVMNTLRVVYRNIFVETLLMIVCAVQIISGLKLFRERRKMSQTFFDRLQLWSGIYLGLFLLIHLSAVWSGRIILKLDTNIYFGIAGLNTYPFYFFFVPYYSMAIVSFFGHLAGVHARKMNTSVLGISPRAQSFLVLSMGIVVLGFTLYGLTDHFSGAMIPESYHVLIRR